MAEMKPAGTNEWGSTFGCFEDFGGCCYNNYCGPCAMCEIGNAMGDAPMGPKNEKARDFMGAGGQFLNCLTIVGTDCCCLGPLVGLCACQEKCCCFYGKTILEGYAKHMGKSKVSPGPCEDPLLQMLCCGPCTLCVMYRELKLTPCGKPPEGLPNLSNMERA